MSLFHHHHDHADHDSHDSHGHGGHGHHHHQHGASGPAASPWRRASLAAGLIALAIAAASLVQVRSGDATAVTRLGTPPRVRLAPGLTWRRPA
ncbi:protease modulator HflC, partial [Pseudomonas syringae]